MVFRNKILMSVIVYFCEFVKKCNVFFNKNPSRRHFKCSLKDKVTFVTKAWYTSLRSSKQIHN